MTFDRKRAKTGLGFSIVVAVPVVALAIEVGPRRVLWIAVALGSVVGLGLSKVSIPDPVGGLLSGISLIALSLGPAAVVADWWPVGAVMVFLSGVIVSAAMQIYGGSRSASRPSAGSEPDEKER